MSTGTARTCAVGGALGVWPPHRRTVEPLPWAELALADGRSLAPAVVDGDGEGPNANLTQMPQPLDRSTIPVIHQPSGQRRGRRSNLLPPHREALQ
jgi:hypothetical protein